MPRLAAILCLLVALLASACGDDPEPEAPALRDPGAETSPAEGGEGESADTDAGGAGAGADDLLVGPGTDGPEADGSREDGERDRGGDDERRERDGDGRARESDRERGGSDERGGDRERERDGRERDERGRDAEKLSYEPEREVERARGVVRRLIKASRDGDSSACTRLMSQRYVEQITGQRGAAALRQCRRDFARADLDAEVEAFGPSEINERECVVRARVRIGDHRFLHTYLLRRGGELGWRLDERVESRQIS